jgi:hypothetical protein
MEFKSSLSAEVKGSSDRSFGLVMAGFFALIACFPLLSGNSPRIWALIIAACFLLPALVYPSVLAPLNRWWMRLGLLLSMIVSPIVLGILFYGMLTPYGMLMRRIGKQSISMKPDLDVDSYWTVREPPGPDPQGMKNQF